MKKTLFLVIFLTFSALFFNLYNPIVAHDDPIAHEEESTPSGSVEDIQKSLQDRIKKALDENLSSAQETIAQTKTRAIVGIVESLSQDQVTIRVNPNTGTAERLEQVAITTDTEITKSNKTITQASIELGSYIIAIGLPDSSNALVADRLILSTYAKPAIYSQVVYATITDIDLDDDTITLQGAVTQLDKPLSITKSTTMTQAGQEITLEDLQINQKVAVIITINSTKKTTTLDNVIAFTFTGATPTPTEQTKSTCGDNICQNVACFGLDCPIPESPETCPADCTE